MGELGCGPQLWGKGGRDAQQELGTGALHRLDTAPYPQTHAVVPFGANSGLQGRPWGYGCLTVPRHTRSNSKITAEAALEPQPPSRLLASGPSTDTSHSDSPPGSP